MDNQENVWCLGESGRNYLIYTLSRPPGGPRGFSGTAFHLDLSNAPGSFEAKWIGLSLGKVFDAFGGRLEGGQTLELATPDWRQSLRWLYKRAD